MTSPRRQPTNSSSTRNREADVLPMPVPPAPSPERETQPKGERIGEILRRTREKRGDDLSHIAEYLCIRRSYLDAIETSDYDKFPADAYVIGFLRSYADLLGIDGKEAINMYRAEMAGRRKKPVLSMPTPMPEGRLPSVFILIGAVIMAILVYAVWYGISSSDRATITTPVSAPAPVSSSSSPSPVIAPVSDAMNSASVPAVPVVPLAPPATQAAQSTSVVESSPPPKPVVPETASATPAAKPPHLVIRAEQSSWVMISDSKGQTVFDRVLKPGEVYKVPDTPGLELTTGNGAGIIVTLDGVDLPRIPKSAASGSSGIMRNIPMDNAHLMAVSQSRTR